MRLTFCPTRQQVIVAWQPFPFTYDDTDADEMQFGPLDDSGEIMMEVINLMRAFLMGARGY